MNIYQEPRLGGASLLKQLQTFANKGFKSKIKTVTPGRVLGGTSKITTWNMQGACNTDIAKTFLSKQKPVALCLQECRISKDNINSFHHKLYNTHVLEPDLVTYIRKDVKATTLANNQTTDTSMLAVKIEGEGHHITLYNVYARDSLLTMQDLEYTLENNPNSMMLGDLNAKHPDILKHSQLTPHNRNGTVLRDYITGKQQGHTPPDIHIHNINSSAEWTHATPDGKWAQIDYIITAGTLSSKVTETVYEDALISDHRGVSVRLPAIFPEYQQQSQAAYTPDWLTFNQINYNILTEIAFQELIETGQWHRQSIQDKVQTFTTVQQNAFLGAINFKQKSIRGNTKPRHIVELIKAKRRIQNKLRALESNTRIRGANIFNTFVQQPMVDQIPSMSDNEYRYWKLNENRYKKEVQILAKNINRELKKLQYKSWNQALEKLAEVDINKAPREFYSTMKKLGGTGNRNSNITCMEYQGKKETTEKGIADLLALNAESSFKPLDEPDFNYENFA